MANPAPLTYTSPVQRVGGGRDVFPNRLLNLLAGIADGQFVKANTNTFESIFPSDKAPNYGPSLGKEWMVINAWSSMGWDSKRHRICLFGGGHANTNDSALYVWDGESGQWMVGYYTPENVVGENPNGDQQTKDGHLVHPQSAHTYSGNNYLPVLDRFYTHGGAATQWGGGWRYYDLVLAEYRNLAGYLCQLELAGKGFVGGGTGNNWIREGGKRLPGARAWEVLDYIGRGVPITFTGGVSGGSDVRVEDGVDVVYKVGASETVKNLRRIRMPSLDITTHTSEHIGRVWTNGTSQDIGCAIEHSSNLMFVSGQNAERFWDIKTAGPTNNWQVPTFTDTELYAEYMAERSYKSGTKSVCPGVASDPKRPGVYVWLNGGRVYRITPPPGTPTPTAGWTIERVADETVTRPLTADEISAQNGAFLASVWGKWKYAPDLDCFVGMQHPKNGDVWLWRPPGWTDPRGI